MTYKAQTASYFERFQDPGDLAMSLYESARQTSSAPARYGHIDFEPPSSVKSAAAKSLEWRGEYGRGGTDVGVARARDLSNGEVVSPDVVRRAVSFFARHAHNKGKHYALKDGVPTTWRIAWDMWGGDPGRKWFESIAKKMDASDKADEKRKEESTSGFYGDAESSSILMSSTSLLARMSLLVGPT